MRSLAAGRRLGRLGLRFARVRVDEGDVEAGLFARRDEEELVALGELPLDDRRRDPRQQVPLHRPLERAGAELGAEPLLDQEVDAASSHSTAHGLHPEAAALEHVVELLLEQAAHDLAAERAEDDDAVEPVQELGAERAVDGLEHATQRRTRPTCRRSRRPGRSGSPSRGWR